MSTVNILNSAVTNYYTYSIPGTVNGGEDYRTVPDESSITVYVFSNLDLSNITADTYVSSVNFSYSYKSSSSTLKYDHTIYPFFFTKKPTISGTEIVYSNFGTGTKTSELGGWSRSGLKGSGSSNHTWSSVNNSISYKGGTNGLIGFRIVLNNGNWFDQKLYLSNIRVTVTLTYLDAYTRNTSTVSFNGNGATSGSVESMSMKYDTVYTLPSGGFEKKYSVVLDKNDGSGATTTKYSAAQFLGWQDKNPIVYNGITYSYPDFSAPAYYNMYPDLYRAIDGSYTYGKYGAVQHYHNNGQNEGRNASATNGAADYYYAHTASDGTQYTLQIKNLTKSANASLTLDAVWSSMSPVTLDTLTRTGYTFTGWYTSASGGTKVGDGGQSYTPTGNTTLYARWESNKIEKIYVGTNQPKKIYIGNQEVKSVYVDTTKVYG